ncbi:MAG: hypothetical protein ACREBP_04255 [Sphingomicrobium sp.]
MTRRLLALAALLALAILVVRNGAVRAFAPTDPGAAAWWWPGHPLAETSLAMAAVGEAARSGRPAGPATMRALADVAVRDPLAIEPLLVRAVDAQTAGDLGLAERLYRLAEARQGRSLPPHFFLADLYLRSGRAADGLREVANLARLSPGGLGNGAPYIAQYAQDPANWPGMRAIFRDQPGLAVPVLTALAQDPANAKAILALASAEQRGPEAAWLRPLLDAMIAAGQYRRVRALWAGLANVAATPATLIHDSEFTDSRSPPPFNWDLAQSSVGLAERRRGSGLRVFFYGSQGGSLVRQMLGESADGKRRYDLMRWRKPDGQTVDVCFDVTTVFEDTIRKIEEEETGAPRSPAW